MNQSAGREIDMTSGPLTGKILRMALPLMLSGILQLAFNAADMVVVGQFAASRHRAIAAVGSTSFLINLLLSLFIGLSIGVNVLCSRYYAAGQERDLRETIGTAVTISLAGGAGLTLLSIWITRWALELMGTPADVIDLASLYMRIYFLGMPMTLLYNFMAAVHQSFGDTRHPLYCLCAAGLVNIALNLVFVIGLHLDVAGVALATILAQTLSAWLITGHLLHSKNMWRLDPRLIRPDRKKIGQIFAIGIPAGLQNMLFNISNVLIQSSINSFGSVVMAGNAAAQSLEGFVYLSMNAVCQTCVSGTSQNFGAGKYKRLYRMLGQSLLIVTVTGLMLSGGIFLMGRKLLRFYTTDQQAVSYGMISLRYRCLPYFLCGIMDTTCGALRGLGHSTLPMIVSLLGSCLLRIVWIYTVFHQLGTLDSLYISYPLSWALTGAVHLVIWRVIVGKLNRAQISS